MFTIKLHQTAPTDDFAIHGVESVTDGASQQFSFTRETRIEDILTPDLVAIVRRLLDAIDRPTMVLTEPDSVVELRGLVLGRLRMLVDTSTDWARSVMIRFSYAIGDMCAAFRNLQAVSASIPRHCDHVAAMTLMQVCRPAIDIATTIRDAGLGDDQRGLLAARSEHLADIGKELTFYTYLIERYLARASDNPDTVPDPGVRTRDEQPCAWPDLRMASAGR